MQVTKTKLLYKEYTQSKCMFDGHISLLKKLNATVDDCHSSSPEIVQYAQRTTTAIGILEDRIETLESLLTILMDSNIES